MSSGKVHDRSCQIFLPVVVATAFVLGLNWNEALALVGGYTIGSVWLSPDIDLAHSKPSKRLGILSYLWGPYRRLSGHRGFSHVPVVGTISRLAYGLALLAPLALFSGVEHNELRPMAVLMIAMGLELSAWVHLVMDYVIVVRD